MRPNVGCRTVYGVASSGCQCLGTWLRAATVTSLAREPYTSLHSSAASGMLDGSVAKAEASQEAAEHASRALRKAPKVPGVRCRP